MGTTNQVANPLAAAKQPEQSKLDAEQVDACRVVLERVLASETFRRCQRLREFLGYVGDRVLSGNPEACTEHEIGEKVFGRGSRFNPADDNIVRATARSLRSKLRDYSETEGKRDPYRIEIPKGSYAPRFVAASQPSILAGEHPVRWFRRSAGVAVALFVVLFSIAGWLAVENWTLRATAASGGEDRTLLSALFGTGAEIHVVLSDALYCDLTIAQGYMSRLEDYASMRVFQPLATPFPAAVSQDMWALIRRGNYTNVAEARAATRMAHVMRSQATVKSIHARAVTMGLLQMGESLVFLGGRRANPWAELYEQELAFQMVFPPNAEAAVLRNREPREGEREVYTNQLDDRSTGHTYARIALTPGLSGTGKVLLAAGNSGEATATAGELLIQPRMLASVEQLLGRRVDTSLTRLELIIERDVVGNSTRDFRVVAVR